MKKIILLSLISFYVYAGDLESFNLTIEKESRNAGKIETVISTPENLSFVVISNNKLNQDQENLIGTTYQTFFSWSEMNISSLNLVFDGNKLSIVIKLKSLIYKDIEMAKYLPSGIQFYYGNFYEYDFRMFKDSLFLRLKGQYYSKEDFLEEIYKAVSDPLLYVQIHDPSYLIRQIDDLRNENKKQDKVVSDLINNLNELLEKYNNLQKENELLTEELKKQTNIQDKLKDAIISLSDRSFFGSLNEFNSAAIEQTIEIKKQNPEISVKEVMNLLKEKNTSATTKTIEAIFIIYFNEFPQNE